MDSENFDKSYLLELFRQFHAEVLRHKADIEQNGGTPPPAPPSAASTAAPAGDDDDVEELTPEETSEEAAERVRAELLSLVQKQGQAVSRRGEESEQKRFREIQYVMAAMADEVFLNLSWTGKDYWSRNLMEEELFQSHDSGDRFFANLEELLKTRDATRAEVAAAYLLALSLGFRGKYQDIEGEARLKHFRLQAFASLFRRNPGLSEDAQLFAQAYAHTATGKPNRWLPRLRPWLMGMGVVVAMYLAMSHLLWDTESSKIFVAVEHIKEAHRPAPGAEPVKGKKPPASKGATSLGSSKESQTP